MKVAFNFFRKKSGESSPLSEGSQESMNIVGSDMSSESPGKSASPSKNLSSNEYVEPIVRFSAGDGDKSSPDHLTISKPNDNEGRNDKVHRSSSVKRVERTSSAGLTGRPATADGAILRSDRSSSSSQVSGIRSSDNNLTKAEKSSGNLATGHKGGNSNTPRSSIVIEKSSDSPGSRSSVELHHTHSREHSFEKSLDNIIDKCSEKSLDLSLTVESKNDVKNGYSDISRSLDDATSSASKKSDKKKKSTSWYSSMFSSTYKSRSEEFRKFFKDIPHDERLIVDYSCALQKDILVHGRMYITQNWICFYANIFRWETVLTITAKEITAVTKERTARVIPNAIQITTSKDKFFFTSFGARDKTYLMLFRIWQNALLDQPMSPPEMWQWIHMSYGDELGLTSNDDDYVPPTSYDDGAEEQEEEEECDDKIEKQLLPKEGERGNSQDIFTSPVPTSVQQQPSTSTVEKSVSRPITKCKWATQEDVYELQCQVLKGQLEEQKLTKEKTMLQIELIKQLSQDQGNGGLTSSQLALFAAFN